MKLHKTGWPPWELFQLHLEGCLEFQGRAGHVLLGQPSLGPSLEVGRSWQRRVTFHSQCQLQPHRVHVGTEHCMIHLESNLTTRTRPSAKAKSVWHQASGAPLQKRQDLGNPTTRPNSTPTRPWLGFRPCCRETDSNSGPYGLRDATLTPKLDNSVSKLQPSFFEVPGTTDTRETNRPEGCLHEASSSRREPNP